MFHYVDLVTGFLSSRLKWLESRLGLSGASFAIGLLVLGFAALYCAPSDKLRYLGMNYGDLAARPFEFAKGSLVYLRYLSPLIAHFLGLRGELFMIWPLLCAFALITLIYWDARRRRISAVDSLGLVALFAFSSSLLFTLHFAGYVDIASYLFIYLAFVFRQRLALVGLFLCLAILNHESSYFLVPWVLYHAGREAKGWQKKAILITSIAVGLVITFAVRAWIHSRTQGTYNHQFYLNWHYLRENFNWNARGMWLGIFAAFKLFWILPIVALLDHLAAKRYADLFDIFLIMGCTLAELLLSSDTSRILGIGFPMLILAAIHLRKHAKPALFTRYLWALILLNLLAPQYYVGQSHFVVLLPLPVALFLRYLMGYNIWGDTSWWG